ncbi:MAG: hypothetical protein LBQ60_11415 [Bacteroidales bacterium]|nr:hypothetical protein [Bacteroidales bacterium]
MCLREVITPCYDWVVHPVSYEGGNVLNAARSFFPECGTDIIETFFLPQYYDHFDDNCGTMTHPELKTELEIKIGVFKDRLGMADR